MRPKIRAEITELTIRSLQDKTSSARRYSIQLLCRLLETHPFGAVHGGTMNLEEWQGYYDEVAKELEKVDTIEMEKARRDAGMAEEDEEEEQEQEGVKIEVEEAEDSQRTKTGEDEEEEEDDNQEGSHLSVKRLKRKPRVSAADIAVVAAEQASIDPNLVLTLRGRKRYYTEALRFINQIESAIPILCELLVSTTKTEVLESMRFFRTAYEYNIMSAEAGIKTMLHLIWTKDNNSTNSTEEGLDGKGIKASLIEVYKSLYFDVVPDLSPSQQVNRITKNMIE
jgi:condensin complex subunit 1